MCNAVRVKPQGVPRMSAMLWQTADDGFGAFGSVGSPPIVIRSTPPRNPETAAPSPVAELTEGQRDCLRLVYNHMTSKDIARLLNVSPHTVDMRLRTAMKTLGVATRVDAARMLAIDEHGADVLPEAYQSLIYGSSDMAGGADSVIVGSPASAAGDAPMMFDPASESASQTFSPGFGPAVDGPPRSVDASETSEAVMLGSRSGAGAFDHGSGVRPLASSLPWGARNTLSVPARLLWVVGIAFGSALSFGAVLSALQSLKALL